MKPIDKITDLDPRELKLTPDFTVDELRERRARIARAIGSDSHLLLASAPPTPDDSALEDANFYYFAGLTASHAYLLVDGDSGRATLFLQPRPETGGDADLHVEDAELIRQRLGIEDVLPTSALRETLASVKTIFTPHAEVEGAGASRFDSARCARECADAPWDQAEPRHERFIRLLREHFPSIGIEDACLLIYRLRMIKSPAELAILRQAGQLSATVMIESMKATRPGLVENRLQAIAEYVFCDRGLCGMAYPVIAAGGQRTWDGHYHHNNATLREDEIVLMDCGPDLRHYASDIARMWPVSGTFSDWHRRMYGFIVAYHKTLLDLVRPGRRPAEIYDEAAARMTALCSGESAPYADMKPTLDGMIERGVRYLNHPVGLSAHDAADRAWRDDPLPEGFVCALDPMMWCDEQREYIRVEDTIAVTADGCERLTGAAPIEIEAIEALMREPSGFPDV